MFAQCLLMRLIFSLAVALPCFAPPVPFSMRPNAGPIPLASLLLSDTVSESASSNQTRALGNETVSTETPDIEVHRLSHVLQSRTRRILKITDFKLNLRQDQSLWIAVSFIPKRFAVWSFHPLVVSMIVQPTQDGAVSVNDVNKLMARMYDRCFADNAFLTLDRTWS